MSFSGVENQWCDAWLERLHAPPAARSIFRLSVGICQRRTAGLGGTAGAGERLYRLWPADCRYSRNADGAPDGPETTGFRQPPEAAIAAEAHGFSPEVSAFGAARLKKYAAPLIVRLDKEGARYFSPQESGLAAPFPTAVVDTIGAGDSHAGGTLASWPPAGAGEAVTLGNAVAAWVVGHRAAIAPRTAKRYSSHTKRIDRCDSS
ncbi:hypothetical protein DMH27_10060 [Raoultella planticola]|nr:hypothetical protein [Raoultella planticola]